MKKYLVVGNPIAHSLSPELHNYWLRKNNIQGTYKKEEINSEDLKKLTTRIKDKEIFGANITVPFKREIISYLDELTSEAKTTQSVNTITLENNKIIGHNTDVKGFENAIKDTGYNLEEKKIFVLGAGGVVPSIIFALLKMKASVIMLSNRTRKKADYLKDYFTSVLAEDEIQKKIIINEWGDIPKFDVVINATSVGLKKDDKLNLDFSKVGKDKFFYDVIYNPAETNFLKNGKNLNNFTENGKKMFIYQAAESFKIWHNIKPEINDEVSKLLDQ